MGSFTYRDANPRQLRIEVQRIELLGRKIVVGGAKGREPYFTIDTSTPEGQFAYEAIVAAFVQKGGEARDTETGKVFNETNLNELP